MKSEMQWHILSVVPDYRWYRGCAPTASAMVLKCLYESDLENSSSNSLIDELADAMSTNSSGSTSTSNVYKGINKVLSSHGINGNARRYSSPSFSRATNEIDLLYFMFMDVKKLHQVIQMALVIIQWRVLDTLKFQALI